MFGSGEITVAPKTCLPSFNFCFMVLYIFIGEFCVCCGTARCGTATAKTKQIVAKSRTNFVRIGFPQKLLIGGRSILREIQKPQPRVAAPRDTFRIETLLSAQSQGLLVTA